MIVHIDSAIFWIKGSMRACCAARSRSAGPSITIRSGPGGWRARRS